ncbi:MAG: DUF1015 domain-containing protein [Clostridium sp.]|nr:DUF1015 domain-containing protein [Clostridium sp.]MBP3215063.1 DUF1015 domain-containing protein [Clostridium sp.]
MAQIRPFCSVRPAENAAARVAALPYDVYDYEEAKREVLREPLSFLRIDRAETLMPEGTDPYSMPVYETARDEIARFCREGVLITEEKPCYYLYELTGMGHTQTGIVGLSSVDDYLNGIVRRHENTRADKEQDRIRHVDVTDMQTGPIFLAYRGNAALAAITAEVKAGKPLYDFCSPDGVRHRVFRIAREEEIRQITEAFAAVPRTYIADGHHRAASAVKVSLMRREKNPEYTGNEEFNWFLSVLFPEEDLRIMPYNRVVTDLGRHNGESLINGILAHYRLIGEMPLDGCGDSGDRPGDGKNPEKKGDFCMLLEDTWYTFRLREEYRSEDPVGTLDVQTLQDYVLAPLLDIRDPRRDPRIRFVGGIHGTAELEREVSEGAACAFSMYPTSMEELLCVADAGMLMPPKSTWFEPKLRSGLFLHRL